MRTIIVAMALVLLPACDDGDFFDIAAPDAAHSDASSDGPASLDAPADADSDGAADAATDAPEEANGDALEDNAADSSLGQPLSCAWRHAAHREVANQASETGASRTFTQLYVQQIESTGRVRAITRYADGTDGLLVHTFDGDLSSYEASEVAPIENTVDVSRVSTTAIGILTTRNVVTDGAFDRSLALEMVPDIGFPAQPATSHTIVDYGFFGTTTLPEARVVAGSLDDVLILAASYFADGEYRTGYIAYSGAPVVPTVVHVSPTKGENLFRSATQIGNITRLYVGLSSPKQVSIPDGDPAAADSRVVGGPDAYLLAADVDVAGATNFVAAELTAQRLRVGTVPGLELDTYVLEDLPYVDGSVDFSIFGADDASAWAWESNQFVALGAASSSKDGVWILWLDAGGNIRLQERIADAAPERRIERIAFHARAPLSEAGGKVDVVWTERAESGDGGAPYDTLMYNELQCSPM
jgi:hypothetical protein